MKIRIKKDGPVLHEGQEVVKPGETITVSNERGAVLLQIVPGLELVEEEESEDTEEDTEEEADEQKKSKKKGKRG